MANQNDNRYGGNRNLWRKTTGYSNIKPINTQIIDQRTATTYSLDLNKTIRHRDFFKIDAVITGVLPPISKFGEYDEGLVAFTLDGPTQKGFNFNFHFTHLPYVTLNVDYENDTCNINPYGLTFSTTGAYIGVSAPFSGNIRYRAIYAGIYPTYVTSAYTTSYMTASAGQVIISNDDEYYSIFGTLPSIPNDNRIYQTAWDASNGTSDIFIDDVLLGDSFISSSLSSLYSNKIHFIVMTSGSSSSGSGFSYTFGFSFGE